MIRTNVFDELTWCCLLMRRWRPYSQQYLVGLVGGLVHRVSKVSRVSRVSVRGFAIMRYTNLLLT